MKRFLDLFFSLLGLLVFSPILCILMFLVYKYDGGSPLYVAPRVGKRGIPFSMVKLRSMSVNADRTGVDSTGDSDTRITPIGKFIRKYKMDELIQLWNVCAGDMSLVGPRPNVERETDMYTPVERHLLSIKPGITDFASIVFSDEGRILKDLPDPDVSYHQLIRPGKSLLGLFYVDNRSLIVDVSLIFITILSIFSRPLSLRLVVLLLRYLGASQELCCIASRVHPLHPSPPPGSSIIVTARSGLAC